jgi:A/G-specific adenine glycosylase
MLQQTQVATVIPYYKTWLRRFPNFPALACASANDVLRVWQGLGYYTRARNLHAAAKSIQDRHDGKFPGRIAEMRKLPGVGKYTAHAIASFAFDQSLAIVEANTARVLARLFNLQIPIDQAAGRQALWDHATSLMPKTSGRDYNSALIDLGALICLPRPKCAICPVKRFCRATKPESLPKKKPRRRMKHLIENYGFIFWRNKILLQQADRRWCGMWILPPLTLDGSQPSSSPRRPIYKSVFPFTHHRVTLRAFRQNPGNIDNRLRRWFPIHIVDSIPIPSPHRRAIRDLLVRRRRSIQG